jgi:hypothetical protein
VIGFGDRMIDRHRALSLIAASPNGCTTTALMAQGIPPRIIADLVDVAWTRSVSTNPVA